MKALVEEDLLSELTGDAGDVPGEVFDSSRSLATAVDHDVPASKKGYFELARAPSHTVQKSQRESDITTWLLFVHKKKIRKLELMLRL